MNVPLISQMPATCSTDYQPQCRPEKQKPNEPLRGSEARAVDQVNAVTGIRYSFESGLRDLLGAFFAAAKDSLLDAGQCGSDFVPGLLFPFQQPHGLFLL